MNKEAYFQLIKELSEKQLIKHLYLTQLLLLTIAFILHTFIFKSSTLKELFIVDVNEMWLGFAAGVAVVIFDVILMKCLPAEYNDDGGLNHRIFSARNPLHIAFIAFVVAFVEELLFRGILQTHLGLWISSIIFAVIHYRYLFNWFLFANIIILSLIIGVLFEWTENILVTIIMHFMIDFLLGIIIRYQLFGYNKVNQWIDK
ncbi:CPBP family intramembrane glutamic endopeptidase [Niallia nealsonii]|uniref:CPBP family intramembrane metalloprotease n=1 Tax=Niallia nealsonii TaxID=115979 RepID=A0A2N0Z3S2_9BACI|nr:CPBP family intramembrane glutamic endopeptidase [Niallia nealsonii]PKG24150.1 CPBP family intramembrane metalloprotease [Niallia nealsonii]